MIKNLFATPLFRKNLNQNNLMVELESFILSAMTKENKVDSPPQSAHNDLYESHFDFFKWDAPIVKKCKMLFIHSLMHVIRDVSTLNETDMNKFKIYHESWFHVAKSGGYFQAHTHPNASWSVVLCVCRGDDTVKNEREGGNLTFIDPRLNASMHLDIANKHFNRNLSFNGYRFRPNTGDIIIFPSYLQHSVEPYYGDKSRISVAANFWFHV